MRSLGAERRCCVGHARFCLDRGLLRSLWAAFRRSSMVLFSLQQRSFAGAMASIGVVGTGLDGYTQRSPALLGSSRDVVVHR